MKYITVMILLAACHRETKLEAQLDQTEHLAETDTSARDLTETNVRDPVDTDTKTTRSENAVIVEEPDGGVQIARVTPGRPLRLAPGSRVLGTVPLTQVLTEQDKHTGPVTDTKKIIAGDKKVIAGDKNTKLGLQTEEETDTGFDWKFYLSVVGIALLVIAAILVILKYKLWRPL
jgi:hypothetical protein